MTRGRFAPSPTGDLHLGGARTALVAWLAARRSGGRFVLRVEDLDPPRVVPGAEARIADDLRALGLDWDEGPDVGGPFAPYRQSERRALYDQAIARLTDGGHLFPCYCSRAEVARSAGAPHGPGDDGPRYPGTCRTLSRAAIASHQRSGRRPSLRFLVPPGEVPFHDGIHGASSGDPAAAVGDFVVRRADGLHAYQLAVVVDDAAMAITDVVRGADLLSSTPRQILLFRALGAAPPRFAHVPLCLGSDGERLAKRHGTIAVRQLLERGVAASRLVARLAATLGLCGPLEALAPRDLRDLIGRCDLAHLPRSPSVIDPAGF
ncbi:MAG: tRNA glutamyl-Q(34) synthetase GluQRS [Myxococcales bacterium]|nr:tRNA glutamyl-Q(34) synthetase GluQRS [Myxococcales bacterium]